MDSTGMTIRQAVLTDIVAFEAMYGVPFPSTLPLPQEVHLSEGRVVGMLWLMTGHSCVELTRRIDHSREIWTVEYMPISRLGYGNLTMYVGGSLKKAMEEVVAFFRRYYGKR